MTLFEEKNINTFKKIFTDRQFDKRQPGNFFLETTSKELMLIIINKTIQ
jgi:hypothetical protein